MERGRKIKHIWEPFSGYSGHLVGQRSVLGKCVERKESRSLPGRKRPVQRLVSIILAHLSGSHWLRPLQVSRQYTQFFFILLQFFQSTHQYIVKIFAYHFVQLFCVNDWQISIKYSFKYDISH